LLIFVAAETGVCVPPPSKLTSASAAIPAFRPCLLTRCLAINYSVTIQLLCFWTLSIILFLFKTHYVSETGFCLRLHAEPIHLGPIDRDFKAIGSFLVTSDVKGFDFSNVHRILQQNCTPKAGGSLDLADSAAHAMSKLDTLLVTVKVSPLLSTDSSDSVRTCSNKLRTNFSDP
jgi:hypothetical protein